ncbi:MAG: YihA family ribosome biogenesis GTP-binding protein [Nitrospinota bacterium]|nr:MAG: YihA family ribosome biogenesis GTP-binding protein [Nitrospinota bacterium]
MRITSAEFLQTAVSPRQYPPPLRPEIAFLGRSNVGKSSLINTLVQRRNLVKTSATPGKTRQINFFLVNQDLVFVDLPGYGYARVAPSVRKQWRPMIETYLQKREALVGVVHILDFRHPPTPDDLQLREWLLHTRIPTITVATKVDKVGRAQRHHQEQLLKKVLAGTDDFPLLLFSARTGEGRAALWREIQRLVAEAEERRVGRFFRRG